MSEGSSALPQTVAALHQYGLLVEYDGGDSRHIALSDLAITIVTNPDQASPERAVAVRAAALTPRIFAELWEAVQRAGLADRAALVRLLTTDRGARGRAPFTPKGADDVLRLFSETITYAGLARVGRDERIESPKAAVYFDDPFSGSEPRSPIDLGLARTFARFEPGASPSDGWTEEPLTDEVGEPILIRYRGKPSRKRYEFIRDFLDLKIKRLERDS